jgi:uncharacterized protein (TIGR03435 family)
LLAERFKLEVHTETRQLPMYELVFAKPGTLGPAMTRSTRQCTDFDDTPASPRQAPLCGLQMMTGRLMSGGVPLADVASWLSRALEGVVVDRTGSSDRFEFTLTWTPDRIPPALSKKAGSKLWNAIDDDGPPLPTALREQLGLRLESKTGPVQVLVLDRWSRLVPN